MDKSKLLEKLKWSNCLFCCKKTLKGQLNSCNKNNCPLYDLCDSCIKIHQKGHIKLDCPMDDDVIVLLHSLNGSFSNERGNNSGIW